MANGLDKLERLFGSGKKEEKIRGDATREKKCRSSDHGKTFPSPSFIRPKSGQMKARQEVSLSDRRRSKSLPSNKCVRSIDSHEDFDVRRLPSTQASSASLWYALERGQSHTLTGPHTPTTPTGSHTITSPDTLNSSKPSPSCSSSPHASSKEQLAEESATIKGSLVSCEDGPDSSPAPQLEDALVEAPNHISRLMQSTTMSSPSSTDNLTRKKESKYSSTLEPSPLFSKSPVPKNEPEDSAVPLPLFSNTHAPKLDSVRSRRPNARCSSNSAPRLSPFPGRYVGSHVHNNQPYSPTRSEGEYERASKTLGRNKSMGSLRTSNALQYSLPMAIMLPGEPHIGEVGASRGRRFGDSARGTRQEHKSGEVLPRSNIRQTRSQATLSTMNANVIKEHSLQDISCDAFWALKDEDVAEDPTTPAPNLTKPPTPPPKEQKKKRDVSNPANPAAIHAMQITATKPASGELTPPDTPIKPQFHASTHRSRLPTFEKPPQMAKDIAKKYGFNVVYVISLWPSAPSRHIRTNPKPPLATRATAADHVPCYQFLAAHGLEVSGPGSPFPVPTEVLMQTLGRPEWRDYRDHIGEILGPYRGLVRSFRSDNVSDPRSPDTVLKPNRGVVFAAYTKLNNKLVIPEEDCQARNEMLEELRKDAAALVDAALIARGR